MLLHQISSELGGAFHRSFAAVATVLTHFNANTSTVAHTINISMLTLLVGWQVLDGDIILNCVVPDQVANAIASSQSALLQRASVIIGIAGVILRAVNGDVAWPHWHVFPVPMAPFWNNVFAQIDLA